MQPTHHIREFLEFKIVGPLTSIERLDTEVNSVSTIGHGGLHASQSPAGASSSGRFKGDAALDVVQVQTDEERWQSPRIANATAHSSPLADCPQERKG